MSRQRTINDQRFWRSPSLTGCTTEDRVALLHLLTCPDSNVIGAYSLIPRIAGAEIGWTSDQWLQVIERLTAADLALYDPDRMFVWVRCWWEHHQATQVMGPKLRGRTLEDLRRLPAHWLQPYLNDFRARLGDELGAVLDATLAGAPTEEVVPAPCEYGIDTVFNFSQPNSNANANSIYKVTPSGTSPSSPVDNSGIPAWHSDTVNTAIGKAQRAGVARADPQAVRDAIGKQFKSKRPPKDVGAYAYTLAQRLSPAAEDIQPDAPSTSEFAIWMGRCYCWPSDNPTNFIRGDENGLFEHYCLDGGNLRPGGANFSHSKLLAEQREGRLREVSVSFFSNIVKNARR